MSVQTIECHIATVLMKRFLDGEDLPAELLADLEKHIKSCPTCQSTVNDQKHSLEEILDGPEEATGFMANLAGKVGMKPATAGGFATAYPTAALVANARMTSSTTPGGIAAFKNPKVLFLSCGLALTLVAMSTVLRDPTMLFGKKATVPAAIEKSAEETSANGEENLIPLDEHGSDPHSEGEEGAAADAHGAESESDAHATEASADTHADEATHSETGGSATDAGHGDISHSDSGAKPEPKSVSDYRGGQVPGEKTVGSGSVVIIGAEGVKTQSKTDHHIAEQGTKSSGSSHAPAKAAPAKSTPHKAPVKKSAPRKTSAPKKSSSAGTKKSSSGIKVYDSNGKPIH